VVKRSRPVSFSVRMSKVRSSLEPLRSNNTAMRPPEAAVDKTRDPLGSEMVPSVPMAAWPPVKNR